MTVVFGAVSAGYYIWFSVIPDSEVRLYILAIRAVEQCKIP